MAEFLFNFHYLMEVTAFSHAGQKLNSGYTAPDSGSVSSLSTATAYVEQQNKIKSLMERYASLIQKDAADLNAMQLEAQVMDRKLAAKLRTQVEGGES